MKLPHTSGRQGCARIEEELIKESLDGIITRTQLFVATHTSKDGSCPFPAVKPSLVYGRDGKGRVRGLGTGVTKTVIHVAAPSKKIVEEEKRKCEIKDENVRLVMQCLDEESTARTYLTGKKQASDQINQEIGVQPNNFFLSKDNAAELYVGEETLADISIGDTITWPKTFVKSI
ncbi:hypothetical protein IFM89_029464 [Coptis chinensis]|uniref:Uncharacterized protein n=1 Tax=Coptis chinensis TaxID=261450 RepID=A0A835LTE0_9MAGN|nr:hypothetical protein IFM89_029464 [Coptis chinensis]